MYKYTMEILLISFTALTATFAGYGVLAPEYRNNSLYTFNIDKDNSIVVMNTQTGELHRCTRDFDCTPKLKPEPKETPVEQ